MRVRAAKLVGKPGYRSREDTVIHAIRRDKEMRERAFCSRLPKPHSLGWSQAGCYELEQVNCQRCLRRMAAEQGGGVHDAEE